LSNDTKPAAGVEGGLGQLVLREVAIDFLQRMIERKVFPDEFGGSWVSEDDLPVPLSDVNRSVSDEATPFSRVDSFPVKNLPALQRKIEIEERCLDGLHPRTAGSP
jgi:hypothetical protein